jgi:DNA-binding transcriptional LysR family regulator
MDVCDLNGHRTILRPSDQLDSIAEFARIFPARPQARQVSTRVNVSSAHCRAVGAGAGIGVVPTYAGLIATRIEPVDIIGMRFTSDIWLVRHTDTAKIPRVRHLVDWLVEAFAPKLYPWFSNEFIHPRDLPVERSRLSSSVLLEGDQGELQEP